MHKQQPDQNVAGPRWQWERLRSNQRLVVATVAGALLLLLVVGLGLNPDPRGLGTHEQLGLPPCRTAGLFHVPCPFCGMTTAFSEMAHGRPVAAFLCQPAGALLFLSCMAAFNLCVVFVIRGQWIPALLEKKCLNCLGSVGLAILGLAWIYKVFTFVS